MQVDDIYLNLASELVNLQILIWLGWYYHLKARSKRCFIHSPNLTDELRAADERRFNSVWFYRLGLERPTTLSSAGSVTLCDVGTAADSHGVLVMC